MKKEVKNKNYFITDLSSSDSSENESDDNKEIPIENKEEIKKIIEKYLLTDEKPKKTPSKKTKKVVKKRESSSSNSDDQEKPVKPIKPKKPKKSTPKDTPKKTLVKEEDLNRFQKKAKKLGATSLDYSKRQNNKYMVEYSGKKIHFGSTDTEDYIIHKDPDRRGKYLTKAMKITNKDWELTYQFPTYPNYWSIKLLN